MTPSFKTTITAAALAGVTAAIINSVLFFLFSALGVISDTVPIQNNQPLTVVPVIISSLIPSLVAGIVFSLLSRYTKNGHRIFSIVAVVLLLLSFANPFVGIPGITFSMGIALCIMHIVVVASLLYFFRRISNADVSAAL